MNELTQGGPTLAIKYSEHPTQCAVVDCDTDGQAWPCPADGARHGHGRIHYEDCHADLEFRPGEWRLVCARHYGMLAQARRAWENR